VGDEHLRLVVPSAGALHGRAVFSDGSAPSEVRIGPDFGLETTFTDGSGEFTLKHIAPVRQQFRLRGAQFAEKVLGPFDIEPGVVRELGKIVVSRGRQVLGKVVDSSGQPVRGASVLLAGGLSIFNGKLNPTNVTTQRFEVSTLADGRFVIGNVPEGALAVGASGSPGVSAVVAVPAGTADFTTTLTLGAGSAMRGLVTVAGIPRKDVSVSARTEAGADIAGVTDESGHYELKGLSAGSYVVAASMGGGPWNFTTPIRVFSRRTQVNGPSELDLPFPVTGRAVVVTTDAPAGADWNCALSFSPGSRPAQLAATSDSKALVVGLMELRLVNKPGDKQTIEDVPEGPYAVCVTAARRSGPAKLTRCVNVAVPKGPGQTPVTVPCPAPEG
jgi:hypothetical protein